MPLREYKLLKRELVKDQSLSLYRAWTTCLGALQQRHCFTALWFCCRHQAVCFFFNYCNLRGKVWATYLAELSVRRVPVLVSYFNRGTHAGQANWCVFSAPLLYSKYLSGERYEEGDTELLTKKGSFYEQWY